MPAATATAASPSLRSTLTPTGIAAARTISRETAAIAATVSAGTRPGKYGMSRKFSTITESR
jgi:hypothetical protein